MSESKIIERNGFVLEYYTLGQGDKTLLALHGHAKSATDYFFLEALLPNYRIITINLFFHGQSKIPEERAYSKPLEIQEWMGLMEQLLYVEKIERFSILAYSLGGRLGLNLVQYFPEMITHVFLMAPDGLNKNGWYHRTAGSRILRCLFKRVVEKPTLFLRLLKMGRKLRIISDRLFHFIMFHMETKEKRKKAYQTWMMYRLLFPDHEKLAVNLSNLSKRNVLLLGKYDAIISLRHSKKFIKKNRDNLEVILIESGHDLFKDTGLLEVRQQISKYFNAE